MLRSLHTVWLITRREYLERVTTKAFLLTTILVPVLMGGGGFASAYLASRSHSHAHIALLTNNQTFGADLKQELEHGQDSEMKVDLQPDTPETQASVERQLKSGEGHLAGWLRVVPAQTVAARPKFIYKPRSASDIGTDESLKAGIKSVLTRERMGRAGLEPGEVQTVMAPVEIETLGSNTLAAFFAAYALFFLMYLVIMLYGMNTARSIIEEKTSRIFEVLLSTIRPDEMLAGKIVGVGAVGLTQVGVWLIAAVGHRHRACAADTRVAPGTIAGDRGAGVLFRGLFSVRLHPVFVDCGGAGSDDELRAGTATAEYVPGDAAGFLHDLPGRHHQESRFDTFTRGLADSVLQPTADELQDLNRQPAAVGDRAQLCADGADHLRHSVGGEPHLSRRHPDVWQEAKPAGDPALAEVQLTQDPWGQDYGRLSDPVPVSGPQAPASVH